MIQKTQNLKGFYVRYSWIFGKSEIYQSINTLKSV